MIDLYGDATGNCRRAAIALEESGLHYRQRRIDLDAATRQQEDFLRLNPAGRVPVIVDDDGSGERPLVVTQSNAIMVHVAEKSGRLLPTNQQERAAAFEWLFVFVTDVMAPYNMAHDLERTLGDAGSDVAGRMRGRALAMIERFDQRLSTREFAAGTSLTLADIAAYTAVAGMRERGPLQSLPNIARWFALLSARPAFQRGMQAFMQTSALR